MGETIALQARKISALVDMRKERSGTAESAKLHSSGSNRHGAWTAISIVYHPSTPLAV